MMKTTIVILLIATFGCKKKTEVAPASGSAGSAVVALGSGSAAGSGSAVVAAGSGAGADPWAAKAGSGSDEASAPVDAAVPLKPLGKDVMDQETIGGFKIGSSAADVIKVLGEPKTKTKAEEWAATGDVVSQWTWPGVELSMAKKGDTFDVLLISIKAPSQLATSRGVTIGSPKADVKANYVHSKEGSEPNDPNAYLVGSPYGGELFTFKGGKVTEIFLGAMAE